MTTSEERRLERRRRIALLAARGMSGRQIARQVGISRRRVRELLAAPERLIARKARLEAELRDVNEEIEATAIDRLLGLDEDPEPTA